MSIKTSLKNLSILTVLFLLSFNLVNAQTSLPYSTDFENNDGGWNGNGNYSNRSNWNNPLQGNYAWLMFNNNRTSSSFNQNFDLANYSTVTLTFSFESSNFNSSDSFTVQLDNNTVLTYNYSVDWQNNGNKYSASVTLNASDYQFSNNNQIRFETTGTSNWQILYIDEISITGNTSTSSTALQSLFLEDFEDEKQGDTNGTDLYGTNWYTSGGNRPSRFEVRNGKYFEADQTNSPAQWTTEPINISNYTNLNLSAYIAFDSGLDDGTGRGKLDYIKFMYKLDGGSPIEIATYIGVNNNGDYNWNLTNVTGNTLEIIIEFQSDNRNNEIHRIDNINLSGIAPAIWRNQKWENKIEPTLETSAIIDDNYNTTNNGNFSCKDLKINTGYKLTVDNKTYVEVKNNTTVNGELEVETEGAFVQINDDATFSGTGKVNKTTPTKKAWYYYTYWGTPVNNMTINEAFLSVPSSRRFYFKAENYLDANGDSFDDNGDDWQIALGSSIMKPGVGYACTSSTSYVFPKNDVITFSGTFNNGVITTPIAYTGDVNSIDHPNLIGNPYASAIDFNEFYNQNSNVIEGVAYYWSQATPANGNGKFSNNDYATFSVGLQAGVAGASRKTPNQFLPSDQGIFVRAKKNGDAIFNNSMRVKGQNDNAQFFKSSNTKNQSQSIDTNKLWVNLTSDNGVFSQILIGYVDGATNDNDGLMYDAPKLESGEASLLYSTIKNSSKRFVIQGKDVNSLNTDEVIPLGFKTKITEATIYTISFAQIEGGFLNGHTIYLKDKLLNTSHNLSESDYSFTSEAGDFNDRFEIAFTENTLSTNSATTAKSNLNIRELSNGGMEFTVPNSLSIKNIAIYNLNGQHIIDISGSKSVETCQLGNLKTSIYIARVTLNNSTVITKRFAKK